jgi:hypothetical protein
MEIRKGTAFHIAKRPAQFFAIFYFPFSILLMLGGCGAPGEPVPPAPVVPAAINDLSARQVGDGVQLTFTLPTNSVTGDRLSEPPAVEILRGVSRPDGTPDAKSFRVVETIPGALVTEFVTQKRVEYMDNISPQDPETSAGATLVYRVRTRASRKRASADSNAVFVQMAPVPQKIIAVQSSVTESAIELSWTAPTTASSGAPLTATLSYHVYRAEGDLELLKAAGGKHSLAEFRPVLLATTTTPSYQDTAFEFGKSYLYFVRSVITTNEIPIESGDSQQVVITPRDTFPPATPQGLVAALLSGPAPGTFIVELSWSINLETDLAGYRVYKSEQEGTRGQLVTSDLLPTPAVRDTSVEPGHRYWYTVTAVDRAGNESPPCEPVAVEVTQP